MKTWTRPKINVQKFVPNSYVAACHTYTDFYGGEAWVDYSQGNIKEYWDEGDIYRTDWPATDPATGKTSIKLNYEAPTGWDAFKPNNISDDVPQVGKYDDFDYPNGTQFILFKGLQQIDKGDNNQFREFYVITTSTTQILARTKVDNYS